MDDRIAYSGCTLDRAEHLRGNQSWLDQRLRDPSTRALPVWRDHNLFAGGNRPRPVTLGQQTAAMAMGLAGEIVFLGIEGDGSAWFACDLSRLAEERLGEIADGAAFLGRFVTVINRSDGASQFPSRSVPPDVQHHLPPMCPRQRGLTSRPAAASPVPVRGSRPAR